VSDFAGAYDRAMAAWPVEPAVRAIPTRFGTSRVYDAGRVDGKPMVLLHGGGTTSASWYATVGSLVEAGVRVYAVDIICDRGRSVPGLDPVRSRPDLVEWLSQTMRGLGLNRADLAGHSYGGWIAAHHAIHAPDTVDRLLLLDASTVFAGFSAGYLLRSVPLVFGNRAGNMRRLLEWETRGRASGPWADLMCAPFTGNAPKLVLPKRPAAEELQRLPARTLVLVAGRARAHDAAKIAATARKVLPQAVVEVLPGATHHTIPAEDAGAVNDAVLSFLRTA
jgi:pimeloyl-ACP methyl ester carboxylesterase